MKKIVELINDIKATTGIRRLPLSADSYEKAERCFVSIANAMLDWRGTQYDADAVKPAMHAIVAWTYALDDSIDYKKGILLKGKTGRGKTFLIKVLSELLKIDRQNYISNGETLPLRITQINAKNLAHDYQTEGYRSVSSVAFVPCLFIDDIGAEMDESAHFGNKSNVIDQVLSIREESNLITFGTTNLNKLSEKYDDRCVSRMNSLFNVVSLNHNKDFRLI